MLHEPDSGRDTPDRPRYERLATNDWCAECGARIPAEEWHPVATVRDDDDDVRIHDFCDQECRSAWQADRD